MIRPNVMRQFAETFGPVGFSDKAFLPSYGLAECTLAVSFAKVNTGIEVDLVDESWLKAKALCVTIITTRKLLQRY